MSKLPSSLKKAYCGFICLNLNVYGSCFVSYLNVVSIFELSPNPQEFENCNIYLSFLFLQASTLTIQPDTENAVKDLEDMVNQRVGVGYHYKGTSYLIL